MPEPSIRKRPGSAELSARGVNAIAFAKLVGALVDGPVSYREISEITGMHISSVRRYVNALYVEGLSYIAGWERDSRGRDCIPLHTLGEGRDKSKEVRSLSWRRQQIRKREKDAQLLGLAREPEQRAPG